MRQRLGFFTAALVAAVVAVLSGCGASSASGKTINLYTSGSDNVRITWEAVLEAFHAGNPGITVNLQFLASGTGGQGAVDRFIAAVKAGQKETDMDILETADNDLARIFSEAGPESLEVLSEKNVPNTANILQKSAVGGDRAMAFRGTTVLLAYNADKVSSVPKTPEELYAWIRQNPGRFGYNDPTTGGSGQSFVITAVYNRLPAEALSSSDAKWKEQWDGGLTLLKDLHPYLYKASGRVQYPAKNQGTIDLLASGELFIIPAWADMILDQKSRNLLPQSIRLAQVEPAFNGGIQTLAVPALSKNKDAAYKLLDFAVSAQGQKIFVESMKAIPVIDSYLLPPEVVDMLSGLEIRGFRPYTIGSLNNELMRRWQGEVATLP